MISGNIRIFLMLIVGNVTRLYEYADIVQTALVSMPGR